MLQKGRIVIFAFISVTFVVYYAFENRFSLNKFVVAESLNDTDAVSLSVEERLVTLTSMMTSYLDEIDSTRRELLKAENKQLVKTDIQDKHHIRLLARSENYFEQLGAFPFVRTVFFKWDIAEMRKYLYPTQYPFTSNDCELISKFNPSKCSTNIDGLLRGQVLNDSFIRLGLPSKYAHDSARKTWTFLHVIQDAVVSHRGDVIAGNLTLTPQRCKYKTIGDIPSHNSTLKVYDEVFDVHQFWDQGFYHLHFESVPRLAPYVKFLNDNPNVMIFLRTGNPITSFLGIKDLDKRRLRDWRFRAKVLYSPAGCACGNPALLTTQLLSLYAKRDLENNPKKRNKIVLIKRSRKRFFRQHKSIAAMLEAQASEHGLELFIFRDDPVPSINLTRRMFNEAIMIIAPHGAGESNMIYAQPGTVIIEGMCFESRIKVNMAYKLTAQLLGMRYYGLLFKYGCFDITAKQIEIPVQHLLQHQNLLRKT
ncbi:hypothetical protein CAPTEDRAFT_196589 [Capitella teleta]|uniref:Glycosyltransferase 61 catalytic domain-containing protein n=1 Tax=Capitella teleta TaxID=283909 RepID=R7UEX3_CAPTE|nr:hypothetical protein CAPTEDRAFT_196589 [Capitella teleta]|eukprot:ELU01832.1 hypothetical protein CAPTEDRAFT_196589 [Capitella teleta]